ncbi:MAG: hypothetical protein AB7K64_05975 [Variibacter sp.]
MRFILGVIVGALLTVAGAYVHDTGTSITETAPGMRPMVNWDVASQEWERLNTKLREQWAQWTAK